MRPTWRKSLRALALGGLTGLWTALQAPACLAGEPSAPIEPGLTSLLRASSGAGPSLQVQPAAPGLSRLGLFAKGRGFEIPRAGTLFDLEGGATFRLWQGLSLIGSYRLLNHDFDIGAAVVGPQSQGPFIGMLFGF